MKEIDKVKKKLKRWEWLNKHLGTCILSVYLPLITLYLFFGPINFVVATASLIGAFVSMVVGGCVKTFYADDTNIKILLEKKIATMEDVTEEKIKVLTKSIENFKENKVMVKDKQTTKRLVKELMKIKACAEKSLNEKQIEEDNIIL